MRKQPQLYLGGLTSGAESRAARWGDPLAVVLAPATGRVDDRARPIPQHLLTIVRWAFYLYVFSLPFEMPERSIPVEVTTLTGVLLMVAALLQARICYRRPPAAFWWFAGYLVVFVFAAILLSDEYQRSAVKLLIQLAQLLLLFWVAYNLMRHHETARRALLTLVAACILLSLLQILGVTATTTETGSGAERISALGQNPNALARSMMIGMLALLGLSFEVSGANRLLRLLAAPAFGLLGVTLVGSGSRMGLLALGAGALAFALRKGALLIRLRNLAAVALAIGFCAWYASQSDTMFARVERTVDEGSFAHREQLYPTAWQMFLERPVLGWGPVKNMWVLGSRVGEPDHPSRDTHNLLLEVLTSVGVLGATPFVVGLCLCTAIAWKARAGPHGMLPFSIVAALLVANVSGNLIGQKLHWLGFAYAAAGGEMLMEAQLREAGRRLSLVSGRRQGGRS